MNEKSVLVEGLMSGKRVEIGTIRDMFEKGDLNDELLMHAIEQYGKTSNINAIFNLVKMAGELSDQVNLKLAELLNEKALTSLAEDFVATKGVCKEAKEIAKGGIWKVDKRGVPTVPKRFGRKPGDKPKKENMRYNCPRR